MKDIKLPSNSGHYRRKRLHKMKLRRTLSYLQLFLFFLFIVAIIILIIFIKF